MNRLNRGLPWVALLTVWFVWGSTYLGIRVAVESIPPFLMAGTRYIIAGAVLTVALLLWNRSLLGRVTRAEWKSLTLMAFLLLVVGNGAVCFAELQIPSGTAALIVASVPIWMVVIDALASRSKIAPLAFAGLALGTGGIIALVGIHAGAIPIVPALVLLLGSISWASGSVYARRNVVAHNNPIVPALEMLLGGVMLFVVAAGTGELNHFHLAAVSSRSMAGFWWLVGPGAIIGYSAYGYAVRTLSTRIVATYGYVNPIVAVVLGSLLLQEPITINVIVGGVAIVLAVIAILMASTPKESVKSDRI